MKIAYYRVRPDDPSVDAQREVMGGGFDREYEDEGIANGVVAARRPGFAKLLAHLGNGDTLHVLAMDRLGRDTIDVQSTVRRLVLAGGDDRGAWHRANYGRGRRAGSGGLGAACGPRVQADRPADPAARDAAWTSLVTTGPSQSDRESLRRPMAADAATVLAWRVETGASIPETARHFGLKVATVKRYGRLMADAVECAGRETAAAGYAFFRFGYESIGLSRFIDFDRLFSIGRLYLLITTEYLRSFSKQESLSFDI